ncbi:hypothetical protein BaRGS_00036711 [Batillaria attramentaria]|uniref:Uncharacterized protein n=1 Tax=Batillaria attramentaria TaxID=370345 RepID=A0ABD0JB16_9CAEN
MGRLHVVGRKLLGPLKITEGRVALSLRNCPRLGWNVPGDPFSCEASGRLEGGRKGNQEDSASPIPYFPRDSGADVSDPTDKVDIGLDTGQVQDSTQVPHSLPEEWFTRWTTEEIRKWQRDDPMTRTVLQVREQDRKPTTARNVAV